VVAYNTHGLHRWISRDEPERRFPLIGERARAYDVVLLQEVFVAAYGEGLGLNAASGWHAERGNPPRPGPLGLLALCPTCGAGLVAAVRPPLSVVAADRRPFDICAGKIRGGHDCWATKGYLHLRLRLRSGLEVDVYDLHLDAGDRGADWRARRRQMETLERAVAERSAGRALIVAGDFNLKQDVRRDRELLERFRGALALDDASARPAAPHWDEVIDYILYRSGGGVELSVAQAGEALEFVDAEDRPLSDHPALFARFSVRPARLARRAAWLSPAVAAGGAARPPAARSARRDR
jgi:endonuclease/exonuclease/phosphatase family metal-dependent hydrolase